MTPSSPALGHQSLWFLDLQAQTRPYTLGSAGSQAFGFGLTYTTAFPGPPAGTGQIVGLVSDPYMYILLTNAVFYCYLHTKALESLNFRNNLLQTQMHFLNGLGQTEKIIFYVYVEGQQRREWERR